MSVVPLSPALISDSERLSCVPRCLAPLHGLDFVTPALVGLAAKKVYLHRIQVATPEKERSMQWGSDIRAVKEILHGVEPDDIIDDVLHMVATPL